MTYIIVASKLKFNDTKFLVHLLLWSQVFSNTNVMILKFSSTSHWKTNYFAIIICNMCTNLRKVLQDRKHNKVNFSALIFHQDFF